MHTAQEIRQQFLDFFKDKNHAIVPSAPIVVKNDPTLMFTNAGMNQFKDFFLGNANPKDTKVTDTQKCLRVSGKHNDLEEVGHDTYHHTMFEMLGNWSFGDYFKKEAIEWAWELMTTVFKIDPKSLYVSVFEGHQEDGLKVDREALDIWKGIVPETQIIYGNKKDNFWEMGEQGPCGPCSEIHVDIRSEEEKAKTPGRDLVNMDHPHVIEVWNLVFMEFNRLADGSLVNLPNKHVDTGMGFERLCMVLQGKQSNYDTDVFQPLIQYLAKKAGATYGKDEKCDIAMRVVSDHVRTIAFAIADGQLPSNNKAGYVIRRILRRAVRYGYTFLGQQAPFMFQMVDILADQMGGIFPEILAQKELIKKVMEEEEASFLRTLAKGIDLFDNHILQITSGGNLRSSKLIDGNFAFELYDTYGFPIDLTQLLAKESGYGVDMEAFGEALEAQKSRSRKASETATEDWVELCDDEVEEFVGYDYLQTDIKLVKYRQVTAKNKSFYQVVFNMTPFYAEGGGQVGDTGYIEHEGEKYSVKDTKKENNLVVHFMDALPKDPKAKFKAVVSESQRCLTTNNHSATHLLHHTLREVLGTHVEQKGSLVNAKHLRFDFSHFSKVSDEEVALIEAKVNAVIRKNINLDEKRGIPLANAQEMGALALFGEKYGDTVRVIKFGDSVELCGGTHVAATGEIGLFKIISEGAVAAGVRRIEAITSEVALAFFAKKESLLEEIKVLVKNPKDPIKGVENLLKEKAILEQKLKVLEAEKANQLGADLLKNVQEINGVQAVISEVSVDAGAMKNLAFSLEKELPNLFMVLAAKDGDKAQLTVAIGKSLVDAGKFHAGKIIKELAAEIKGGGGGQAHIATAGGKDPNGIKNALEKAKAMVG
jgi:alanyl-tRNA synthetase